MGVLRRKILGKEGGGDPPAQKMTAAISPSTMQGSLFSPLPLSYISHSEQGREGPPFAETVRTEPTPVLAKEEEEAGL